MEGDRDNFPMTAVANDIDQEADVSTSVRLDSAAIDGDFEVVVGFRTNIIIEEWIRDAERAINAHAITNYTVLDWRIEAG